MATAAAARSHAPKSNRKPHSTRKLAIVRGGKGKVTPIKPPAAEEKAMQIGPASALSPQFIREAKALDAKIIKEISNVGRGITALGRHFQEARDKGTYIPLGFKNLPDYIAARWPDQSKTQVYEAMRVVRELGSGDNPVVPEKDLNEMPATNASGLARLRSKGTRITPKLIDAAKTLSVTRFQEEIVMPKLSVSDRAKAAAKKGQSIAGASDVTMNLSYSQVRPETVAAMARCADIFRKIGYDPSIKPELKFEDQFLQALTAEFEATHAAEYESGLRDEEAEGQSRAVAASEAMGPAVIEEEETDIDEAELESSDSGDSDDGDDEDVDVDVDEEDDEE
jgi:hypothetical protein